MLKNEQITGVQLDELLHGDLAHVTTTHVKIFNMVSTPKGAQVSLPCLTFPKDNHLSDSSSQICFTCLFIGIN